MSVSKIAVFITVAVVGLGSVATAAPVLTGAVLFNATATGAYDASGVAWNTLGGDLYFNLYFQDTVPAFINSGNGAGVALSVDLTPGSYFFNFFGSPGLDPVNGFVGLNLFFDGATTTPDISAFNTIDGGGAPTANSASTLRLDGAATPGSGTLSFTRFGNTVTLSTFLWNRSSGVFGDVVSPFGNAPDGENDYWGTVRLDVTGAAVPEPGTFLLIGAALVALGLRRRF
ncbi:MAG: PEP-CTERM sorting domain-containing protein [Bryobacteraceae bacterium]